jgi:hypothetical protein
MSWPDGSHKLRHILSKRRLLLTLTLNLTHLTLRGSAAGPLGALSLVVEVLALGALRL